MIRKILHGYDSVKHNKLKNTAIVCAYNEEKTIGKIVEVLLTSPALHEIIIINDGSTDGTITAINKYSIFHHIHIIDIPVNMGKGYAMFTGVVNTHSDILVFMDADLMNFDVKYIIQLIQPLIKGKADMVIGQPTKNFADYHLNLFRPLAGERALFRQDILPLLDKMKDSRFGVETLINLHYKANNMKTIYVSLQGLQHPTKLQKYPFKQSVPEYISAAKQIMRTVSVNFMLIVITIRNILIR